jgi:D-alanyl-lipoteichoic acid acyltransferase DltB (MBOAT superfamily)
MVVNSWPFLLFFIVVFIIYYLPIAKGNSKFQNAWLLLASYFFYGYIDVKMIALLLGSTVVFYLLGLGIRSQLDKEQFDKAAWIRTAGVVIGVGILFYFKYLNFFADSVAHLLSSLGMKATWTTLNIVMPVGVSFFTFKLISYVVEVCRERIEPTRDFVSLANYVSFFPTILSGPIDRPNEFLQQLEKRRDINEDFATDGFRQILWGMFKKMVVADNLSDFVNFTWDSSSDCCSLYLLVSIIIYPIQMYMDFSGYSDMAIGVGKILNIKVAKNFNYPFFVTNVAEYWRRWHISLTGWLTDYVFMPINVALRDKGVQGTIIAIVLNFLLIGMWHGANWTFVLFGLYYGLLYIPLVINGSFQKKQKLKFKGYVPDSSFLLRMLGTYLLVAIGLIIFRAPSLQGMMDYLGDMLTKDNIFTISHISHPILCSLILGLVFAALVMSLEWRAFIMKGKEYAIQRLTYNWQTYALDAILILIWVICANVKENAEFIYMKF